MQGTDNASIRKRPLSPTANSAIVDGNGAQKARASPKALDAQNQKGLFDLPAEVLDQILLEVYRLWPIYRRFWAAEALSTSKAFYKWLLPIVRDERLRLVEWELRPECVHPTVQSLSAGLYRYKRRDLWWYLAKRLGPAVGSGIRLLTLDGHRLSRDNFSYFIEFLHCCPNLKALAMDRSYELAQYYEGGTPFKRKKELSTIELNRIALRREARKKPKPAPPPSTEPLFPPGGPNQLPIMRQVQRVVLRKHILYPADVNLEWLFYDRSTKKNLFPALTSACLILYISEEDIEMDARFINQLMAFCTRHKQLQHLELYISHVHEDDDRPCSHRVKDQIEALKPVVAKSKVSITLQHQSYCEDSLFVTKPLSHVSRFGSAYLRVFDIRAEDNKDYWHRKITQINDQYKTKYPTNPLNLYRHADGTVFDEYTFKRVVRPMPAPIRPLSPEAHARNWGADFSHLPPERRLDFPRYTLATFVSMWEHQEVVLHPDEEADSVGQPRSDESNSHEDSYWSEDEDGDWES